MANEIKEALQLIQAAQEKFKQAGLVPDVDVWFHASDNEISVKNANNLAREIKTEIGGYIDLSENFVSVKNKTARFYITTEGVTE